MRTQFFLSFLLLLSFWLSSCVSQRKYLAEFTEKQDCLEREKRLRQDVTLLKEQLSAYSNRLAYQEGQISGLNLENQRLDVRNRELQEELNRIINNATSAQESMEMALRTKANDLAQKEQLINQLRSSLDQRDSTLNSILGRIQSALQQYTADELSIEIRDGKVYVALSDRLLFESGSASLNRLGKEALGKLASALSRNPDLNVRVEGHTDNVPIRTSCVKDNWDLSVLRATSVVRTLSQDYNLSPTQVTASGRSEFFPKASNETREGRALNRRTEIIIEPKLEEIFGVLNAGRE